MSISVFINTLNEAKRIEGCLQSVQWADEIVVVDMQSDDETQAICRQYTNKIYSFNRIGYCEPARKYAVDQTTGDWILNIDADELVTLDLKNEILTIIKENTCEAAHIPRKNYFWGHEMKYAGCGLLQDRPLRLYKRSAVEFTDVIHAGIKVRQGARVINIDNPQAHLVHFSYLTPDQYWDKLQRYTTIEAKALFDSGRNYTGKDAFNDGWEAFYKRFIKKSKGYKDKEWGLIYCLWTAIYKLNIYAKYKLMKKYKTVDYGQEIEKEYQQIKESILREH